MNPITITVNDPNTLATLVSAALKGHTWSEWDYWFQVGRKAQILGLAEAEVIHIVDKVDSDRYENEQQIVFKVSFEGGQEVFYRLDGTADSYGDRSWSSRVYPVNAQPRTITVYERA